MSELKHTFKDGSLKVILGEDMTAADFEQISTLVKSHKGLVTLGLDLHNCTYIQSKMLAELIALKKLSMVGKFNIALLNVNDNISQVLEMSSLLSFFTIEDDFSAYDIDELCDHFFDPVEAQYVSDYIASNYDDSIRQKLISVVKSDDAVKAEYALLTMGRAQDFGSVGIFHEGLDSDYYNVKRAAVLVLGWIGDTDSKERIYSFLADGNGELSEAAAASIALLSDESDSEKLSAYLYHKDAHVRKSAVQALSLINDDKGFAYIADCLGSEKDDAVRVALTRSISSFNREEVTEMLIKLLDDSTIAVREAAASGILRVGPKNYVDTILAKVADNDDWVGFFAAKSLAGVCDARISRRLIEIYHKVDQNVKLAIIEVLGRCSSDNAEFLMARMDDENEDIRKEALNSLDNSNSAKALETALKLFKSDASWLVRYKAVEMIVTRKPEGYEKLLRARVGGEDNRYVREKILNGVGE